jgi:hypothetical protein
MPYSEVKKMATKKNHTAELAKLAADVPSLIDVLEDQIAEVVANMAELKETGLIYATEHWRKDAKGDPKYFYLLYPQKNGEARRRDYVGCDAQSIAKARAGIVRAAEYDKLAGRQSAFADRARRVAEALHAARRYLTTK